MLTEIIHRVLPLAGSIGLSAGVAADTTRPTLLPSTTISSTVPNVSPERQSGERREVEVRKDHEALKAIEDRASNYMKTGLEWGTIIALSSAAFTYILLKRQVEIQQMSLGVCDLLPRPHHPDKETNGSKFYYATGTLLEPGVLFKYHMKEKAKFYSAVFANESRRVCLDSCIAEKIYSVSTLGGKKPRRNGDDLTQVFFASNMNGESLILNRLRTQISTGLNDNQHLISATDNANERALGLFLEDSSRSPLRREAMLEQIKRVNVEKLFVVGFNQMDLKKLRVQIFPLTDIVHMLVRLKDWRSALDCVNPGDRRPLERKFVRNIETACLLLSQYPDYLIYLNPTLKDFPNFMQEYQKACIVAESLVRLGPLDETEGLSLIDAYLKNPAEAQLVMTGDEQRRLDKKMYGTKDHVLAMQKRENRRQIHRGERCVGDFQPEELPKIFVRSVDMPS